MATKPPTQTLEIRCVVCETHCRPSDVPWPQHTVGCAVRAAQLVREAQSRPALAAA